MSVDKARVLVAEDDAAIAVSVCSDLEGVGFQVVGQACSGGDAVRMAAAAKPDVVVMDIRMPEMDGVAAAERIYAEHGIPVVILTAYSEADLVKRAISAGVFGYLIKPVVPEALRAAIETALSCAGQVNSLTERVNKLETDLAERKVVERAKGILMRKRSLGEEEAYLMLRRHSRDSRRPMAEIAQSIIDADELLSA
jgi:response regulator NasT